MTSGATMLIQPRPAWRIPVQGIGDGSLFRPRFAGYIGQDAFYLQVLSPALM